MKSNNLLKHQPILNQNRNQKSVSTKTFSVFVFTIFYSFANVFFKISVLFANDDSSPLLWSTTTQPAKQQLLKGLPFRVSDLNFLKLAIESKFIFIIEKQVTMADLMTELRNLGNIRRHLKVFAVTNSIFL